MPAYPGAGDVYLEAGINRGLFSRGVDNKNIDPGATFISDPLILISGPGNSTIVILHNNMFCVTSNEHLCFCYGKAMK